MSRGGRGSKKKEWRGRPWVGDDSASRIVKSSSLCDAHSAMTARFAVLLVALATLAPPVCRGQGGSCPEKNGRYPTRTCDGYIECKDGVPEEKLCPDGLLFNAAAGVFAYPCQYPIDVDCTGREQVQPAQPTAECPHQYGYFRIGDAVNCGQFMNCAAGRGYEFNCPEGLAFNGDTYRCDWPDQVPTCDAEGFLGFTCPPEPDLKSYGLGEGEYRFYRSQRDCQHYYICINQRPRMYNCGEGRGFNDLINACDGIENVTGCAFPQPQDTHGSFDNRFAGRGRFS